MISAVAQTTWTIDQLGSYMLIDNITYGVSAVPEASSLSLVFLGLVSLLIGRRRQVFRDSASS